MREQGLYSWRNPWFRWSVGLLVAVTVVLLLLGFVVVPSVHPDFTAQGLWAGICRAAGVPAEWSGPPAAVERAPWTTGVVLERSMARAGSAESAGHGGTLASTSCTMCHGAQGVSASNAPNLAGQYPEVVIKQLRDFRSGARASPIMQAMAKIFSDRDVAALASYYAGLPRPRREPTSDGAPVPALVHVGAPLRNIAPCVSCHGGVDHKLGTPWLDGMPKDYLVEQLRAFRSGARGNDAEAQMRNMARGLTDAEIEAISAFYAGTAGAPHAQ